MTQAAAEALDLSKARSIPDMLLDRIPRHGSSDAYRVKRGDTWEPIAWDEFFRQVKTLGVALRKRGFAAGDRVAIVSNTRYEWTLLDIAALSVGIVVVPIYQTSVASTVKYILNNCGAKAVFCELEEHLDRVQEVAGDVESLVDVFGLIDSGMPEGGETLADVLAEGREHVSLWEDYAGAVKPADVASIVYTSGTTGDPQGRDFVTRQHHRYDLRHSRCLASGIRLGHFSVPAVGAHLCTHHAIRGPARWGFHRLR